MSSITSRRPPLVWHPEWPALMGWVFVAVLVCLLYSWYYAGAVPVLLGLLLLCTGVGGYLSTRERPHGHFAGQQRQLWNDLSSVSQTWMLLVVCLVPPASSGAAPAGILPWQQRLLYHHLAWLQALRLHRAGTAGHGLAEAIPFLEPTEAAHLRGTDNPPAQLLARQVKVVRQLYKDRSLTDLQLAALLSCLEKTRALSEAVHPPEPPPQTRGWVSWTWPHAALLTGLLASILVETGAYSLWLAVPLTGLIYWTLAIMTSSAFPDNVPAHDVSHGDYAAAVCRRIETDVLSMPVVAATALQASS